MKQLAQGDVLLVRVAAIPAEAVEVPRDGGRVVLAYGEVTGHSHGIDRASGRSINIRLESRGIRARDPHVKR